MTKYIYGCTVATLTKLSFGKLILRHDIFNNCTVATLTNEVNELIKFQKHVKINLHLILMIFLSWSKRIPEIKV